jgi:hypothetical protein
MMNENKGLAHRQADRAGGPADLSRDASQPKALIPCAFTPGPWRIDGLLASDGWGAREDEDSIEIACIPHDGFDALEIFGKRRNHDDYAEHAANARLIAAAPDLFAALDDMVRNYGLANDKAATACSAAIAALRKARGQ